MDGVDDDGNTTSAMCGGASEHAGFAAVRVDDVRLAGAEQVGEVAEGEPVFEWMNQADEPGRNRESLGDVCKARFE